MRGHVGEHMFGTVKVSARGQIVIPKEARDVFDIETGDALLVIDDAERGIAIVKNELFKQFTQEVFSAAERPEQDR